MFAPFVVIAAMLPHSLELVRDGHSDWVIVAQGEGGLGHGAHELRSFIRQISGADLPIVSQPLARHKHIWVKQDPALKEEEYRIRTGPSGVTISGGGKRGPMYGCYGFLQDHLGCRWYTAKVSHIPRQSTISIPPLDIRQRPAFEYRDPYFREAFDKDWGARNRVNGSFMPLDESYGGKVNYGQFVHTFSVLVPPDKYFKEHPEYFSLVDGKRQGGYAQLCLTNPDVLKIVVDKVKGWIRENPKATIFSVSQNDTYLNCQCENCKAIEREEGSPSGPLLRFVNEVADQVGKEYPNVLIDTLAYQWSEKPPSKERPHKNVRVRLAPINACFSHPLDGCKKNESARANLLEWSKITNQLYVWHYCTNFANYLQPLPDLDEISRDIKYFHEHGVVGLFYEGDYSAGGGGDMAELKSYLMAQLMWNPDRPAKPIIDEFLSALYGQAAPEIALWLDKVHEPARHTGMDATIYDPPTAPYLTSDLLTAGTALFDRAEKKVRDDPSALDAVQRARLSLEFVQLAQSAPGSARRTEFTKIVGDKIRRYGITETSEGGNAEDFLKKYQ